MDRTVIIDKLNKQIEVEAYASQSYLAMSIWLDDAGFDGFAKFMMDRCEEERLHMFKVIDFIKQLGHFPVTPRVKKPKMVFEDVLEVFSYALELEEETTASIYAVVKSANKHSDYTTVNFMNWFIEEQLEEEDLFRTFIAKIQIFGNDKGGLYLLQEELKNHTPEGEGN